MTWHCSIFKILFCKSIVISYSYNGHLVIPASNSNSDCVWSEDMCNHQKLWTVLSYVMLTVGAIVLAVFCLIFFCCLYRICCLTSRSNACGQPSGCYSTTAGSSVPPFNQPMSMPVPMPMPMSISKSYNYPPPHQINMQPIPEYGINPSVLGPPPSYTPSAPPPSD